MTRYLDQMAPTNGMMCTNCNISDGTATSFTALITLIMPSVSPRLFATLDNMDIPRFTSWTENRLKALKVLNLSGPKGLQ